MIFVWLLRESEREWEREREDDKSDEAANVNEDARGKEDSGSSSEEADWLFLLFPMCGLCPEFLYT